MSTTLSTTARRCAGPWLSALGAAILLGACATHQPYYEQAPYPVAEQTQPMYFYPQRGQGEPQQDRDRYECYRWAVQRTGIDPGMTPLRHVTVASSSYVEPPPGRDTVLGAAAGAAIGAATASRGYSGEGAIVGLVLGALIGAASDQARADSAYVARAHARQRAVGHTPPAFQRAMSACMSGRGYVVR